MSFFPELLRRNPVDATTKRTWVSPRHCFVGVSLVLLIPVVLQGTRPTGKVVSALLPTPAAKNATAVGDSYKPNYAASATNLRHWDKHEVHVRYIPSPEAHFEPEEAKRLLGKSLELWNHKIGSAVTLILTDATDAEITITLVKPGSLAGGAIGRTDVLFRLNDQVLTRATIRLNASLRSDEVVQVAAHELGHALGIQGHSSNPKDLMYPYAHMPAVITDRDLNTMAISYAGAISSNDNSPGDSNTSAVLPPAGAVSKP